MMRTAEVLARIEELGGWLEATENGDISYRVPKKSLEAITLLASAKSEKQAFVDYLLLRQAAQALIAELPGLRLAKWHLKQPPVAIETCAAVLEPELFVRTTLQQLRIALANPKRWVGWSVPQLIDRLAQVGVSIVLESKTERGTVANARPNNGCKGTRTS